MTQACSWTRISVDLHDELAEAISVRLGLLGFAVEIQDGETLLRPAPGRVRLVVYTAEGGEPAVHDALLEELGALEGRGLDVAGVRVEETSLADANWRDAWKEHWRPERFGERLLVQPSFRPAEDAEGRVVVTLDPGRAFGTGTHASTRLCLLAIDAALVAGRSPRRVLDVGTGSGILAIAAALAWPEAAIVATDIDPEALEVTRENAEANGLGRRILRRRDLPRGEFDLVLANIQLDAHIALARGLAGAVAPGGDLVLAGLLQDQGEQAARTLAAHDLSWIAQVFDTRDPIWCAEQLRRHARTSQTGH